MTQISKINPHEYFEKLIGSFPELKKAILEEDEDLIHFRMELFADYTIGQIESSNWKEVTACFLFQEQTIPFLSLELENALNVSYCESLLLGNVSKRMKEVCSYMPPLFKNFYLSYERYYDDLVNSYRSSQR